LRIHLFDDVRGRQARERRVLRTPLPVRQVAIRAGPCIVTPVCDDAQYRRIQQDQCADRGAGKTDRASEGPTQINLKKRISASLICVGVANLHETEHELRTATSAPYYALMLLSSACLRPLILVRRCPPSARSPRRIPAAPRASTRARNRRPGRVRGTAQVSETRSNPGQPISRAGRSVR